jgi:hypothetical protein
MLGNFQSLTCRRMISQMARHRNSAWASGFSVPRVPAGGATAFEECVRRLRLQEHEYAHSVELRTWCRENKDRCYIPEWLLKIWGMFVEPGMSR